LLQSSTLLEMEVIPKSVVSVQVSFEMDLEYDPFTGRTLDSLLALVEDDLFDAINELRPEIQDVYHMQTKPIND
jgi:hypothetical protein